MYIDLKLQLYVLSTNMRTKSECLIITISNDFINLYEYNCHYMQCKYGWCLLDTVI